MKLTKAIIPVAGYGTRRLPVSKALEKCMMPVLNRPIVDYVVQDCIAAGIRDFYFVVNEGATQLRAYYSEDLTFEDYLRRNNKEQMVPLIQPPADCTFHFIEQSVNQTYGTTVPVWLCREHIDPDEHVLVIMGDQFFVDPDGQSEAAHFIAEAQKAGTPGAMLAVQVPHEDVSKYGIVSLHTEDGQEIYDNIVEKPSVEEAPTNLNNGSFYLLDHNFFTLLDAGMQKLSLGEHLITDVLNAYAKAGNKLAVIRNRGEYLDCGNVDGWLYANNTLAKLAKN